MKNYISFLILLCSFSLSASSAQKKERKEQHLQYDNADYLAAIKSVQFYNAKEEQSLPLLPLNSDEQLFLSFDDLRGDGRTYYYTVEHCSADWQRSNLSTIEYIEGLTEDRIYDYKNSVNTLQAYTHYQLKFPNEGSMKPKLAGNYLLKVYEDADQSKLILTKKFYVYKQSVGVSIQVLPSFNVVKRKENQKLNVTLNLGGLVVNNPYQDIKIVVKQNRRDDIQEMLTKPMFVKNGQLVYNNNTTLDFDGGNEFRTLDLRSFRLLSAQLSQDTLDSIRKITVMTDQDLSGEAYSFSFDENGKSYIRNNDFEDQDIEGDYALVSFTLEAKKTPKPIEKVYIVGMFNHYKAEEENEMKYDADKHIWQGTLFLKQGAYQYTYKRMENGNNKNDDPNAYNGHHFETGNTYDVFVYYRKPATNWEELVGFSSVNTSSVRDNAY